MDCGHHSCYRGRYIILNRPDISAVECCNRGCVFPCVGSGEGEGWDVPATFYFGGLGVIHYEVSESFLSETKPSRTKNFQVYYPSFGNVLCRKPTETLLLGQHVVAPVPFLF